jgi:transposase
VPPKVPDPKAAARYHRTLSRLRRLQEAGKCDLYYGDESGFCLRPCLPYLWQTRGRTLGLPAQAHGKRVNAFSMARRDGQMATLLVEGRFTATHVVAGIEFLLRSFPDTKDTARVLILDNASIHRCEQVKQNRKEWRKRGLRVLFLPSYSPHLNPVERLWRQIKYRWLAPAAYETYQTLCQALDQVFDDLDTKQRFTFV